MNTHRATLILICAMLAAGWPRTIQKIKSDAASEEIRIPAGKENRPAEEVFQNIQILRGESASRFGEIMKSVNRALGVRCSYCHIAGAWAKDDLQKKRIARKMFELTRSVREKNFDGKDVVNCWTCHRGSPKPPNGADEIRARLAQIPEERQELIQSIDPGPDKHKASEQVFQNIQVLNEMPADQMVHTMAVFTVVLGVECSQCHLADQWDDDDKSEKQTTREMMQMVSGINHAFPETQKNVTCWTCHRGEIKPESIPKGSN